MKKFLQTTLLAIAFLTLGAISTSMASTRANEPRFLRPLRDAYCPQYSVFAVGCQPASGYYTITAYVDENPNSSMIIETYRTSDGFFYVQVNTGYVCEYTLTVVIENEFGRTETSAKITIIPAE